MPPRNDGRKGQWPRAQRVRDHSRSPSPDRRPVRTRRDYGSRYRQGDRWPAQHAFDRSPDRDPGGQDDRTWPGHDTPVSDVASQGPWQAPPLAGLPHFEVKGLQAPLQFINVFDCDSYRRLMFNFERAFKRALFPDGLIGDQDSGGWVGFTGSASLRMGDLLRQRSTTAVDDISQRYLEETRLHFPLLVEAQSMVLGERLGGPVDYPELRRLGLLPHLAQCQYLQLLAATYMIAPAVNQAPLAGEHGLYLVSEITGTSLDRTLAKILLQIVPPHLMRVAPGDHASGVLYTAQVVAMWFRANYFNATDLAAAIRATVPPRPRCLLLPLDPEPRIPGTDTLLVLRRSPPSSTGVTLLGAAALDGDAESTLATSLCVTCGTHGPARHTFCRT